MANPSKIHQLIVTDIVPKLDAVKKEAKAQFPRLDNIATKLLDAIKKSDGPTIQIYLKGLEVEEKNVRGWVVRVHDLRETLGNLEPSPDYVDDLKEIEAVTAVVNSSAHSLDTNFGRIKVYKDQAIEALTKLQGGEVNFSEDWAVLEDHVEKHLANAKWRLHQTEEFLKKGNQAVTDRNQTALTQWVNDAGKFVTGNPLHADVVREFSEFCTKVKAGNMMKELKDEVTRELPGMKKSLDDAGAMEPKITQNFADIKALKIKPVDYHKAIALLKLHGHDEAKLKKALESANPVQALDALAKELKLKTKGQDMYTTLQKAKII